MKAFTKTSLPGVFEIDMFHSSDTRGTFVKPYHKDTLDAHGLVSEFRESFYSTNKKGVIRGMHFQYPPHEHAKIVYCTSGKLIDVILDLRKGSPTFGKWAHVELSGHNYKAVYLPVGVAHGFCVLEDNTTMVYLTSTVHAPMSDAGVLYNSFGYSWPVENPVVSERDLAFPALANIDTPFIYSPV